MTGAKIYFREVTEMQQESLFSKRALRKISSPEELDQLMHVTGPREWIALIALGILVIVGIFWCIAGKIPVTVHGTGILLRSQGIIEAICLGEGQLEGVYFQMGQEVQKGQLLAKISQPLLENRTRVKQEQLGRLKSLKKPSPEDLRLIEDLKAGIEDITRDMEIKSDVHSPVSGVIIQKLAARGDYVNIGQSIADIEVPSEELICIIFIPVSEGEDIQPGMKVKVSPEIASGNEYGFMCGSVKYVSLYPQRKQGLMRFLKNEQLAAMFTAEGPPLAIYVELEKNPGTSGGYKWSSSRIPKVFIRSGTLCTSTIVMKEVHPLSLVFAQAE
jgi:hypothetical protein